MEKEEASGLGKRHLTLKDRAELEALYNKGRGVEEIAAKLALPLGTVKTQIHRAREQMCRLIAAGENK